ncbi:MAG: hypothetical protein EA344_09605, partial [Alkalicoccus sp.]
KRPGRRKQESEHKNTLSAAWKEIPRENRGISFSIKKAFSAKPVTLYIRFYIGIDLFTSRKGHAIFDLQYSRFLLLVEEGERPALPDR